jgi:hypothetical protein
VHPAAGHHGGDYLDAIEFLNRTGGRVAVEHDEVGRSARHESSE